MTRRYILTTVAAAFGILLAISWIAAYGSGWAQLASHFPAPALTPASARRVESIVLSQAGGTPFTLHGTVKSAVLPSGLYLAQSFPFLLFARPILIPWHSFSSYSRTHWGGKDSDTNLLTSVGIQVAVPDPNDAILAECRTRRIREKDTR